MAFLGQEEQVRELQDRFRFLYVILFLALGLLLSRLVFLQILSGDKMRQYSEENRIKRVKVAAPRGMIFDRNRKLLIDNHPSFDLEITPQYLRESGQTNQVIHLLSKLIEMPENEIETILEKAKTQPRFLPIKIKTDLSRDEVAKVEMYRLSMPGVSIVEEIKRTNLYGDIASHLFGYIGEVNSTELPSINKSMNRYKLGDMIGKSGLEQRLEDILRGIDGEKLVEVDALGRLKLERTASRLLSKAPKENIAVPGKNLVLTIDQDLQNAAAKAFGDKAGALVAIDPKTGQILSMISRPSYDPTEFSRGIPAAVWDRLINNEDKPLRDKTLQDHYPPGSVFKVVTAIAGLEEGVIDENTRFNCGGSIRVGNKVYFCHKKGGHGEMNVINALTQSCDVFFYRVAQKLKSVDDLAKWAFHLGLGKRTGINLAHEVPGLIPTEDWKQKRLNQIWNAGETLSVAIGQGFVITTTIQLANLYAAIANGGTLYRPYVVSAIESADGKPAQVFQPQVIDNFRLKSKTFDLVKQGLWSVVNTPHGTGFGQRLPGMDMVGKTGTAQVIRLSADKIYQKCENMRYRYRHHGLFAAFAPVEDPVIAVAVIGEHSCHGASGAAPIARAVIKTYLEKTFPEKYGEKAIAEAKKAGKLVDTPPARVSRDDEEELPANDTDFVEPEPASSHTESHP